MKGFILNAFLCIALFFSSFAFPLHVYALGDTRQDNAASTQNKLSGSLDLTQWWVHLDPQKGPSFEAIEENNWQQVGNGTNGTVSVVTIDLNGLVYIGGDFTAICGNAACDSGNLTLRGLAVWDGTSWQGLGGYGTNGAVYSIAVTGTHVYIGGIFDLICTNQSCSFGTSARNIAHWNGSAWSALSYGLNSFVYAVAANGNTVYAGGHFTQICGNSSCSSGNVAANHLVKWDGVQWSSIGYGVSASVYALLLSGTDLYVGGYFTNLCANTTCSTLGVSINYIARWSVAASTWYSMGNGLSAQVRAIAAGSNGSIFVGGFFTQTCGNQTCNSGNLAVNRIARWNGSDWSALGYGVNSDVYAIAVRGSNVYIGGNLTQVCGNADCNSANTTANRIAGWNGSAWSALANGVNAYTGALAATNTTLYAGGMFTLACGDAVCSTGNTTANRITRFSLPVTTTLYSRAAEDGFILETSEASQLGGTVSAAAATFNLGDSAAKQQARGILSFSTSGIPDTAVITAVTLRVKKYNVVGGGDPLSIFQGFMIDVKNGFFTSTDLLAGDFQAAANKTYGPVTPVLLNGWYNINLTPAKGYVNKLATGSGLTQFRLRFKLDDNNDALANYLVFYSGNAGAADQPQLVVTYSTP